MRIVFACHYRQKIAPRKAGCRAGKADGNGLNDKEKTHRQENRKGSRQKEATRSKEEPTGEKTQTGGNGLAEHHFFCLFDTSSFFSVL
jgi:hypothetical protein